MPTTCSAARRLPTILIVSDDDALRHSLAEQLEQGGEFSCVPCTGATAAQRVLEETHFDAALIDAALTDPLVPRLCCGLRRAAPAATIILLTENTAAGDTTNRFGGLIDESIAKPFRLRVLLERLRARLQPDPATEAAGTIGRYRFRADAKLLIDPSSGRPIRLTEKETAILDHLSRARGRVVARDALLRAVWGYRDAVMTHTLETHIYRLRQKIERDPAHAELLMTEPGGYRLVG